MTNYDAGAAVATYNLKDDKFQEAAKRILATYRQLEAAQSRALKAPVISAPRVPSNNTAPVQNVQALSAAQSRAIITAQKLATEQQRTAQATTNAARADQVLAREVANTAAAQDRAASAALRRQQAEERAARQSQNGGLGPALPRTFAGFTPQGFNQALGAFGLANFGPQIVGQAISAGVDAGKQAIQLRETQRTLQAVSGSTEAYGRALKTAREQQRLFGGSLQENIEGLTGLQITARQSGADLNTLIDLSQRLGTLDPAQGVAGARVALSEALSGDPTSLAKRYEIPKAALKALRDESTSAAEKLAIIDRYLNNVGITSEAVAGKVDETAKAYRELSAEIGDLTTNVGGGLAGAFERAATGLGRVIGIVNGNPEAMAKLNALLAGRGAISEAEIEQETKIQRVGNALRGEGDARDSAFARDKLAGTTTNIQALDAAKNQLVLLASQSDEMSAKVRALYEEFGHTGNVEAFNAGVRSLAASLEHGTKQTDDHRQSIENLRSAMDQSAQASVKDAAEKDAQSAVTELLAQRTKNTVDQFLALNPTIDASAAASLAAAQGYDPQIVKLIQLGAEARNAKADLDKLAGGTPVDRGEREFDSPQDLAQARTAGLQLVRDLETKNAAAAKAAEDARRRQILLTGSALEKVQIRQLQYNEAVKEFGKNSAQAIDAQTDLIQSQQDLNKPKRGPADPQAKGLSPLIQDQIQAGETLQEQLTTVNGLLEKGNLTEHQRNDLVEKRRSLTEKIAKEEERARDAALDAARGINQDAQKRLEEARAAAGLQRALESGRLAGTPQEEAARLRLQEISLDQQKRAADIQKDLRESGGLVVGTQAPTVALGTTPQLPLPNLAQLPALPQQQTTVNLTINVDKAGNVSVAPLDPGVVLNLIGSSAQSRNLSGGAA